MLAFLLLAAVIQDAEPAPAGLSGTAFTLSASRSNGGQMLSIGTPERFLSILCAPGHAQADIYVSFPETIGFSVRTANSGGYRVRYSFDGGEEHRVAWSATGDTAIASGRYSGSGDFLRRLRGTRAVRLGIRRQGGGDQEVSYAYPDPAPLIDEMVRRCGLDLGR